MALTEYKATITVIIDDDGMVRASFVDSADSLSRYDLVTDMFVPTDSLSYQELAVFAMIDDHMTLLRGCQVPASR